MKSQNLSSCKKSILAVLFAVYITFILLSQIPFLAENLIDISTMEDSYEYNLSFPNDGKQGHYYVERYDTLKSGYIHVTYTTDSNSLEVDCTNIKVLKIYCREMYEKKSEEVFKLDPKLDSNYFKTYFIERDHFHVHVSTQNIITELSFVDTPVPYNVTVNGQEWWLTGINYTYSNNGIVLTKVPSGHSYVDIYFKSNDQNSPVAKFTVNKLIAGVRDNITFDASGSFDPDGKIVSYVWDFGEGNYGGTLKISHSYQQEGIYTVILTVIDNNDLINRASQKITVVNKAMSIMKSVDKPKATPGSILTYRIMPVLNSSWLGGVKDVKITDVLPAEVKYVNANPLPEPSGNNLTWNFEIISNDNEFTGITLITIINENLINNTIISNYAVLEYKGLNNQRFPMEVSPSAITEVNTNNIFAPKILNPVPDVLLIEDGVGINLYLTEYEFDLQDRGTSLKWFVTGENESLYTLSGEYSDDDIITITPKPEAYGNSIVTLWLVDSEGYTVNQPLWINITPVNDAPVFFNAPDLIIHYDDSYTFNYEPYISDIDTPKNGLQLLVQENIEGSMNLNCTSIGEPFITTTANTQVENLNVIYNYPESYLGKRVYVLLVIFDGVDTDGQTIQINITDDYTPKSVKKLPNLYLNEGEKRFNVFDLDDYFTDPDKDSLFYTFGETYVNVQIHENHTVDLFAPSDWNGIDTVTFRAKDPIGAIAEDTILITVLPVNDPPVISGVPKRFIVHYDADYRFDLTPYIYDEDNETEDLYLNLKDIHIRPDPLKPLRIIMNYPRSMLNLEVPVIITVTDGMDQDSQTITVKVTEDWPPDQIKEIPDVSFYEDESLTNAFNLNEYFTDKDSDTLYYTYGQKFVNITITPKGGVDFLAAKNWFGIELITFRATDSTEAFVESIITVIVIPVNDPPAILPLPIQNCVTKRIWRFDLTEYLRDVDNNISKLSIMVESKELEIVINGKELLWYSNKPIEEEIKVIVSDGLTNSSGFMLINIKEEELKPSETISFFISILWLLILLIIIIISITAFTFWRKYNGNYSIEEIFWIYNNGLLISHVNKRKSDHLADRSIISSMLTAITDFVKDAFAEEEGSKKSWEIKEIQMFEKNILVEKGNYSFIAIVFSGRSGKKLYLKNKNVLRTIENKYDANLKTWNGNLNEFDHAQEIIKSLLLPSFHKKS